MGKKAKYGQNMGKYGRPYKYGQFGSHDPRPCGLKHNLPILHFGFLMYDH